MGHIREHGIKHIEARQGKARLADGQIQQVTAATIQRLGSSLESN